ncbi:MAG: glycosyltransferase family A protein, partial [Cyclobacteriaceae bacterium]
MDINDNFSELNLQVVSIIIPCYNHGAYLSDAIESCLKQTYQAIEIIVVDDGSTDNTPEVAQLYPNVKYIYQENQGLSSARNTGIKRSKGGFLVFLDADDLLFEDAINCNIGHLLKEPEMAFVSGGHQVSTKDKSKVKVVSDIVHSDHYLT